MQAPLLIELPDEDATHTFANVAASCLHPPQVFGFSGALGAGKTTFIRSMLRALGVKGAIKSPTFALVETYEFPDYVIHHFDLYRLTALDALDALGFRDYFAEDAICLIEWPMQVSGLKDYLDVLLSFEVTNTERRLTVDSLTPKGETFVEMLRKRT